MHQDTTCSRSFVGSALVKNPPATEGDTGLIPGWGRSPGEGNGNPLQYSCLRNPMDRGAWRALVHGATKSQTWQRLTLKKLIASNSLKFCFSYFSTCGKQILGCSHDPHFLVFMPLYKTLPSSVGRTWGLLLSNKIWQGSWWDVWIHGCDC